MPCEHTTRLLCTYPERLQPVGKRHGTGRFLYPSPYWAYQFAASQAESQAAIARREGITRARVSQIMSLLRLAPQAQQHILSIEGSPSRPDLSEHALRPILQVPNAERQMQLLLKALS